MNSVPTPPPQPRRFLPVATGVLIAINVGVWLLQVAGGVSPTDPSSMTLLSWGGDMPLYTLTGDTWRLLTAMFLHVGIVHLALNMYVLAFTAPLVEVEFGTGRMLAIYLAGGLLASCASVFWGEMRSTAANPVGLLTVGVGASGAVMALFGSLLAGLVLPTPRFAHLPRNMQPGINKGLIQAVVINIGMGFMIKGVDNAAHVGGLLGGAVLGIVMAVAPLAAGPRATLVRYLAAAGLVAVCAGALLRTANKPELVLLRAELDARRAIGSE
ncbi:MAG TPA: rhomboid family intramembrane serine protease [Burkholderiaceae bacterium]|jgi:membrane associated rhomboid family serine protease|nr:rhomboid family intramembrane serine protease [Burkholderiaceae bacterium]